MKHLVTTSVPVPGLTDADGHVPNPKALESQLHRLRRLDRSVARARRGSKNHRRLLARRARLHGRIAKTRALHLHPVTTTLAGAFDVVAVETLNVKGMANQKRRLGRRLADAALGELRRQLDYKTADYGPQSGGPRPVLPVIEDLLELRPRESQAGPRPNGSSDATTAALSPTAT